MPAAALDIGGTKTMAGIISEDGRILAQRTFPTDTRDWRAHFADCAGKLADCIRECGAVKPVGLGINVPGMTDPDRRILRNAVFAGWKDVDVFHFFRQATAIDHIVVENDVNACAYGELRFGYGEKYRDFVWITVSTGVGGAVAIDGHVVRGAWGCAGEVGHIKVEYDHPALCPCGQLGCLEAQGSGTAIAGMMREAAQRDEVFASLLAREQLATDAKTCAQLAGQGNAVCLSILQKAATYLGRGISASINLLNPQAVILGGGVAGCLPLMAHDIQRVIENSVISTLQGVDVVYTKNGYNAAILGAASLVLA